MYNIHMSRFVLKLVSYTPTNMSFLRESEICKKNLHICRLYQSCSSTHTNMRLLGESEEKAYSSIVRPNEGTAKKTCDKDS